MYLVSAYFDEHTNKKMQRYINQIADKTGNTFMTDNQVPPHLTISAIEARGVDVLVPYVEKLQGVLTQGKVQCASVGMLLPYVLYVAPVLNEYLQEMSQQIYDAIPKDDEITISRYYRPMQWLPHITLGKKLTKEQMQIAVGMMQDGFAPFEATVTEIGLAKVNPHEDVVRWRMK